MKLQAIRYDNVVGTYPGFNDRDGPVFLCLDRQAVDRTAPGILSLRSWDKKLYWQARLPMVQPERKGEEPRAHARGSEYNSLNSYEDDFVRYTGIGCPALSPDGHILALAQWDGHVTHVWSWRDGVLLGAVQIPITLDQSYNFQVQNNARVWLNNRTGVACRLWAIDGYLLAFGSYSYPRANEDCSYTLASNGAVIEYGNSDDIEYANITVHGNRVKIIHCKKELAHIDWDDYLQNIGSASCIDTINSFVSIVPPLPAHPWSFSISPDSVVNEQLYSYICSYDRSAVLLEKSNLSQAPKTLQHMPFIQTIVKRSPSVQNELELFTAPGQLRAILPISSDMCVSSEKKMYVFGEYKRINLGDTIFFAPDNQHLLIVAHTEDYKLALLVYGW